MNQRRYKPKLDRAQRLLLPDRVEDYVGENHQVRALDAYVNTLDLAALGFKHTETGTIAGQPPYNPWALLKLYLYGYQHGIRSSRKLEAETRRNLEVIWLVEGLQPSYKSLAMKKKGRYSKKDFTYDVRGDCYYCPQGKQLKRPLINSEVQHFQQKC